VDYGTNNPCVFQLWGNDGKKRYLRKEYYYDSKEHGRQKTDAEYAQDLVEFLGPENVWSVIVDPSAASFKVELAKRGFGIQDADNDVLDGIREVSSAYSLNLIQIDPSCVNNIREKSGYVWDIKASQRGEDKPVKQNDHCQDCERYYVKTVPLYDAVAEKYTDDVGYGYDPYTPDPYLEY
jgi:phage terminase large subunit